MYPVDYIRVGTESAVYKMRLGKIILSCDVGDPMLPEV